MRTSEPASSEPASVESGSILFVCTANICRSPMAERLLRAAVAGHLGAADVEVSSAGVAAEDGQPMDPEATAAVVALGGDAEELLTRRLTSAHVDGATVVLAATRTHRATAARLVPRAARRCFTVREFDRYLQTVDVAALPADGAAARLAALVEQVEQQRGTLPPADPDEDDLADPYRMGAAAIRACAEQLAGYTTRLVDLLAVPVDAGDATD